MKILVTTDFSANSKTGIRFAVSLAKNNNAQLIFFHSYFLPKPTSWSEATYALYAKKEKQKLLNRLNTFVAAVCKSMKVSSGKFKCVVEQSIIPESGIMDYAKTQTIDFICISTRGAGMLKKIFGTTVGNLITKSQIPVIAVPQHYKAKKITHILYASDLKNHWQEMKSIIEFAKPLRAAINVFHFSYPGEKLTDVREVAENLKRQFKYKVEFHLENSDLTLPLVGNLQKAIASSKPSLVVMFTEQRRTFYQKIFLSSSSESISFQAKVPMLVFNKTNK